MTWQEKVSVIVAGNGIDEMFLACNFTQFPPVPIQVDKLVEQHTWLPQAYQEFLNMTNGAQLGTFLLFGVEGDTITTIQSEEQLWEDSYSKNKWLPIGKDASGNPILLRIDGTIHLGSIVSPGTSRQIADNFDTLLDDVFMGDSYSTFMDGNIEGDDWHAFLVEQSWTTL